MKRVLIESPFAGDCAANLEYLRRCIMDCIHRGEAPFASHGFYTQFLNDDVPAERALGMEAGWAWGTVAQLVAVYADRGVSVGMELGIDRAQAAGIPITYRYLRDRADADR